MHKKRAESKQVGAEVEEVFANSSGSKTLVKIRSECEWEGLYVEDVETVSASVFISLLSIGV